MRKQARAPGCSARDAQLHPSLTSHPVIPMAVEILKTYLCRGESRNNGSDGDESPGRGRQTYLGRQGAISFLPSACFVRHLLLPHPRDFIALYLQICLRTEMQSDYLFSQRTDLVTDMFCTSWRILLRRRTGESGFIFTGSM